MMLNGVFGDNGNGGILLGLGRPMLIPLPSLNHEPTPTPQLPKKRENKEGDKRPIKKQKKARDLVGNPANGDTTAPLDLCLKNYKMLKNMLLYLNKQEQGNLALVCQGIRQAVQAVQKECMPIALRIPLSEFTAEMLEKRSQLGWGIILTWNHLPWFCQRAAAMK